MNLGCHEWCISRRYHSYLWRPGYTIFDVYGLDKIGALEPVYLTTVQEIRLTDFTMSAVGVKVNGFDR